MGLFKMHTFSKIFFPLITTLFFTSCNKKIISSAEKDRTAIEQLRAGFLNPPDSSRPGVYWYFMDGNLSGEGMTADLEAMKQAGIGNVVFLEVNVGVPRGPVDFLSEQWYALFKHAIDECKRLGINMTLGIGPGWAGSGGPWVKPAQSMQQLVLSCIDVSGAGNKHIQLPVPTPMKPYFGEGVFTPALKKEWEDFYEDVAVLAFPVPDTSAHIADIYEKALYYRAPYSSTPNVKPYLPSPSTYTVLPSKNIISKNEVFDLTDKLHPNGILDWVVPEGKWTIMRFGRRNNGAITRPAPVQGLGFESDKFDTVSLNSHLEAYIGRMLDKIGKPYSTANGGLKFLHIDSWEMGAQNWTGRFREEFIKRRGYDPLPFYPVYAGKIVESEEMSERFLWDLRQTSQDLILEYHAGQVKKYSHRRGLGLSIEPYDMNPTADLELGAVADIPMCEFWSKGFGFNTSFSCIEATSIAHVKGEPVVQAEAFTADDQEAWKQYPGSIKNQGDWAFATGINRLFYHTFAHKPLADSLLPGMTMGPYGVHWDRKQTWWPMAAAYHRYISRCQFILQQGKSVAEILYLTPEGAPQVFLPPPSALDGNDTLPDRKGYNFDGCSPGQLYSAFVQDHKIVFPGGASYRLLVLPASKTMTPALLEKIRKLVKEGATVVGEPPVKSPGLSGFPECDQSVQSIAAELWGTKASPAKKTEHIYGKGKVISGVSLTAHKESLYPEYKLIAELLDQMHVPINFESTGPIRYSHRSLSGLDIYFVSNRTDQSVKTDCKFRTINGMPELWDPVTGKNRLLPEFTTNEVHTIVPLQFAPYQSFFIVFAGGKSQPLASEKNFSATTNVVTLTGDWSVSFDPKWGGSGKVTFDHLADWSDRPEPGIKYFSGIATYSKTFDLSASSVGGHGKLYLDLGEVKNVARVRLNGHDLGVLWTAPWEVDITSIIKEKGNQLEIEVANLWPNRLIGDQQFPDDGVTNGKWPSWLMEKTKRPPRSRFTFTNFNPYKKDSPLLKSGLIGPVNIMGNRQ